MTEQMQQIFEDWRAVQPDGGPSLRQELAYKDGFADALKVMQARSTEALVGDLYLTASEWVEADLVERV